MAQHGKDLAFSVEDSAGTTLRVLDTYLTKVDFDQKNDTHDNTTSGAEGHTYQVGLTDGTIGVEGFWDKTASTGAATVLDSLVGLDTLTVGFEYGPEGRTTGLVKYSGECVLESVVYSTPVAALVTFSARFKISGSVAKGVFA